MKIEEIQQRASRVITEKLDIDGIGLMEDPSDFGADQLDCIEIVMALEDEFDIEIPDDDRMFDEDREFPALKCVEKIADSIADRLEKNGERIER